jgi:hypothetical protein
MTRNSFRNSAIRTVMAETGTSFAEAARRHAADAMPRSLVRYDFGRTVAPGLIPFAVDAAGRDVYWDLANDPHLLLLGRAGSGKTVGAHALLYGAAVSGCELVIIEPFRGTFDYACFNPWAASVVSEISGGSDDPLLAAAAAMQAVCAEMLRRRRLFAEHGVTSIQDLPLDVRPATMVVLIDQYLSVISEDRGESAEVGAARNTVGLLAVKIAAEARSSDIHLVLSCQKLPAVMAGNAVDHSLLKANTARILFGKTSATERAMALRAPEQAHQISESAPPGSGIWETPTTAGAIQISYASMADYADNLERLARTERSGCWTVTWSLGDEPGQELEPHFATVTNRVGHCWSTVPG